VPQITALGQLKNTHGVRTVKQAALPRLPTFPTTTIVEKMAPAAPSSKRYCVGRQSEANMSHTTYTPRFVDCQTASDLCPIEQLREQAESGQLVLRFSALSSNDSTALIARLSRELSEHVVFQSRFDSDSQWITILPVVSQARILEHREAIHQAMAAYIQTCTELIGKYEADALPQEWTADDHGEHCQFVHASSGQTVEAPFGHLTHIDQIDPYFFAVFVKSTSELKPVAELIAHDFHDAARILETMVTASANISSI
jgi:hypothetical protein